MCAVRLLIRGFICADQYDAIADLYIAYICTKVLNLWIELD